MTKAELIASFTSDSIRVINVELQADSVKEAAGVKSYIANVLERKGDRSTARNIGFYVVDEGTGTEAAYVRDDGVKKSAAYDLVKAYLEGLRPATVLWYAIDEVDEPMRVARCRVIIASGTDLTEKNIIVYKTGSNPITHKILV
jgi:hypothetical protein